MAGKICLHQVQSKLYWSDNSKNAGLLNQSFGIVKILGLPCKPGYITIISLFVRELFFAQLFPASLLVSPEIEIKLKKRGYYDIFRYIEEKKEKQDGDI